MDAEQLLVWVYCL